MNKKILFFFIIIAIIIGIGLLYRYSTFHHIPATTPITTTQPLTGNSYQTGNEIAGVKFSLTPPKGWRITVKEDQSVKQYLPSLIKSLNIYVLPPENTGDPVQTYWGGFIVNIFPAQTSIDTWFSSFLSTPVNGNNIAMNNRSYYTDTPTTIGNKIAYYIQSSNTAPDLVKAGFAPRDVLLGTYYTYELSFFQNSDPNANERITNEIFPILHFQ